MVYIHIHVKHMCHLYMHLYNVLYIQHLSIHYVYTLILYMHNIKERVSLFKLTTWYPDLVPSRRFSSEEVTIRAWQTKNRASLRRPMGEPGHQETFNALWSWTESL